MFEEACYFCRHSDEMGWDGLGWCLKNPIKKLVREGDTCEDFEVDCERIDDYDYDEL